MAKKIKRTSSTGQIRIIGGQWRGRKLPVLCEEGLRPTTDRVKEMLFNWLQGRVFQPRCLDLFAGSGSLTFEALSRFAREVVALERFPQAATQLSHNQQVLKLEPSQLSVHNVDTLQFLRQSPNEGFDLIFMDPPFRKQLVKPCVELLMANHWLNPGALVYVEREKEDLVSIPWELLKEKVTGQVRSQLYQVE